jgi:predicted nucleotidyltransferase
MRLTNYEVLKIKETFYEIYKSGKIYLFGSRVNDCMKGGDIDLYIVPASKKYLLEDKIKFLVDLKSKIGDQKIDVIISKDKARLIEREGLKGIEL